VQVEAKLAELGVVLPAPMKVPDNYRPMWRQVRVIGDRAVIAGPGPRGEDGSPLGPGGKVGHDLT
jgi:hypothetical protein